ncbi:MAG: tRNA (adenosine(37)-N6)-threonylcarbamoyltransferase complex transferase subunit TsaD, partial [Patescibacteria group bacterium]
PEVAARLHANNALGALEDALSKADVALGEIDVVACTANPGLVTSLLVGKTVAKTLAETLKKPLLWIDHIEAHMFANFLERDESEIRFPAVCLTVSGGHNEIYLWKSMFERALLGETIDDAAGEAFDKVAKAMGLGFPGGPVISKLASEYEGPFRGIFPVVTLSKDSLDFSFSGLKTAVKREIDRRLGLIAVGRSNEEGGGRPDGVAATVTSVRSQTRQDASSPKLTMDDMREIAFEFERTVAEILSKKLFLAAEKTRVPNLVLAGGVSSNDFLKKTIAERAAKEGFEFRAPVSKTYSQDNAAMVGILAYYRFREGKAA